MPVLERNEVSCGTQLMYGLYGINALNLDSILRSTYKTWGARHPEGKSDGYIYKGETIIFSDAVNMGNGRKLARIIKAHDLGRVVRLRTINPNTRNEITTYLWCYNGKRVRKVKNGNRKV